MGRTVLLRPCMKVSVCWTAGASWSTGAPLLNEKCDAGWLGRSIEGCCKEFGSPGLDGLPLDGAEGTRDGAGEGTTLLNCMPYFNHASSSAEVITASWAPALQPAPLKAESIYRI